MFLSLSNLLRAQDYYNFEVKTYHLKKAASHAEREKDYFSAIVYYEKYLIRKPSDYKASFALAQMYRLTRDYHRASQQYQKAYELEVEKNILALYFLARMHMTQERYDEAVKTFSTFRKKYKSKKNEFNYRRLAKARIEGCEMALIDSSYKDKVYLNHLKNGVNMAYNEAAPVPRGNDQLVFASLRSDTIIHYNDSLFKDTSDFRSSFYLASKENKEWVFKSKLKGPFEYNDFDVSNGCFSLDKKRFYYTKCSKNWKFEIICHIFYSEWENETWSDPVELNENINQKKYSSTQPSVGLNPKNGAEILFYSSNRPEGRGEFDLWYSEVKKNEFSESRNLGGRINTDANEVTPFFDPESSILYFSSDGHPGYGELDIFKSFGNKSKWMKNPENLGKPFNSPADDLYYIYGESPEEGFITSNREGGIALKNPTCCDDIYTFVYDEFRRYSYNAVIISDNSNYKISDGEILVYLRDPESSDTTYLKSAEIINGKVSIKVERGLDYLLIVQSPDHFIQSLDIPPKNRKRDYSETDTIVVTKLSDQSFILDNIYYDFDDWKLRAESELVIDNYLLKILQLNPEIKVEISSHTDAKGSGEYNIKLSQKRAESVVMYLRKKGISSSRMVAKGYGKTNPIAPNTNLDGSDNPEGRQLNRRTEFKVIGFKHKVEYKKIQTGKNVK